jgi:hypothetical protein
MVDSLPLPSLDAWQVTEIKLLAFPLAPQAGVEQNWWSDLTGLDCTSTRKRLERIDKGPLQGRDFTLSIDALKVVWSADFLPDPESTPTLMIGAFAEVKEWFSQLMLRWLTDSCPPVKRLAFAAKVVFPTSSREAAYETLRTCLPHIPIDPATREFLYRINRPRASSSGVNDLRINRLVTWSAVRLMMQWRRPLWDTASSEAISQESVDGCFVQLDINSSEERADAIPHDSLPALWNELAQFGAELVEHGDVP